MIPLEQATPGNDIDRCPEENAELLDQVDLVEKRTARLELSEEVDIAGGPGVSPRYRAEHQ